MIGKLHPLLVHLPIGFFFLALLVRVLIAMNKVFVSPTFFRWVLGATFGVSLLSLATGWLLSRSGDYDASTVAWHQWSAVAFTATMLLLFISNDKGMLHRVLWGVGLVILILTGHFGGSLTHGADFLVPSQPTPPIEDVQEAEVYQALVRPILEQKCTSCHGEGKQKGKLRVDTPAFLQKGGTDGPAVVAFDAGSSLLMQRILLPESHDDHMPPKGKPQLTSEEVQVLEWWIKQGADFHKRARDLEQDASIAQTLLQFQSGSPPREEASLLPEKEVKPAKAADLEVLRRAGVLVNPVGENSSFLEIHLRGISLGASELKALAQLKAQTVRLNASGVQETAALAEVVGKLENLATLHLQRSGWSDADMQHLSQLKRLQWINLSFTAVTKDGLKQLAPIEGLKRLFLYKSAVEDLPQALKTLPRVAIDTGGYSLQNTAPDSL